MHRVEWRVQSWGWCLWGLLIAAALAGLLGNGPAGRSVAHAADGSLTIQHDRLVRHHAISIVNVDLHPQGTASELQLFVSQSLLDAWELRSIQPLPTSTELDSDGAMLRFARSPGLRTARISLHIEPEALGTVTGMVRLDSGEPVRLRQFVFP